MALVIFAVANFKLWRIYLVNISAGMVLVSECLSSENPMARSLEHLVLGGKWGTLFSGRKWDAFFAVNSTVLLR